MKPSATDEEGAARTGEEDNRTGFWRKAIVAANTKRKLETIYLSVTPCPVQCTLFSYEGVVNDMVLLEL